MGKPAGPRTNDGKSVARVERARRQARASGKFTGGTVEHEPERAPVPPPPPAPSGPAKVVYPPAGDRGAESKDEPATLPAAPEPAPAVSSAPPAPAPEAEPAPPEPEPSTTEIHTPPAERRAGFVAGASAAIVGGLRG